MAEQQHYVIIGNGPAGDEAARHLRQHDADCSITLITADRLLFIPRFELFKVLSGTDDWRQLLAHQPEYYKQQRINVRRNTTVTSVDTNRQVIGLKHKEELRFDKLLVASGGGGYIPEELREYRALFHRFGSFESAIKLRNDLPEGGQVVMLGGDMMGIDLARNLVKLGYRVTLITDEHLFWPHEIGKDQLPEFHDALTKVGIELLLDKKVARIEKGEHGLAPRRVICESEESYHGDVVLGSYGLMPKLDFMASAGLDVQRGLLVSPELATSSDRVWAAGDVCQIWSPEHKRYRVSYDWSSVKRMGRVAARNMAGGHDVIDTFTEQALEITKTGELDSPYWDYS